MQIFFTVFLIIFGFQNDYWTPISGEQDRIEVENFQILPDEGFSLEQVLSDSTLKFTNRSEFNNKGVDVYWIRVQFQNVSNYSHQYYISTYPNLKNTVYTFNMDDQAWEMHQAGYFTPSGNLSTGLVLVNLAANANSTIYIKVDNTSLGEYEGYLKSSIVLAKQSLIDGRTRYVVTAWYITLAVVIVLFLYNGYIYLFFRDETYLYYLILLIGGIFYVTGVNRVINLIYDIPVSYSYLSSSGILYVNDFSVLLADIGLLIIMVAFIQMTRFYLKTKSLVSRHDRILKYFLIILISTYALDTAFSAVGLMSLEYILNPIVNLIIMLAIVEMIWAGFSVYRKAFKPAKYYLWAHSLPLLFILALAFYFVYFQSSGIEISVMSNIVTVLQALTFAIALVARMQLLKSELGQKTLELRMEKVENEKLNLRLEYSYREMASSALYQSQRNELLVGLKTKIDGLSSILEGEAKTEARKIKSAISNSISLESDWEKFKLHFEQVHPNFFEELKLNHPNLTQNETRLSAYFHINLSVKEIATLMNIAPDSVRKAKTRLNKKIKQKEDVSLSK